MKKHPPLSLPGIAVLLALAAALSASVHGQTPVFVDPATPEAREIQLAGENAINRLATTMVGELRSALAKGTAEDAVDLCHLKNLPMTGDRITGLPRIKTFRLTSLKVRAPANAPDEADQLALDRIDRALNAGDPPPKLLVQRIDFPNASTEWRVSRPLGIMPQCVACHGDPAEQSPALRTKLETHYPADKATGYSPGEWRGLIRVTVADAPTPTLKPKPAPRKP